MTEEWRDVKGYRGLYQVSNFGRVNSLVSNSMMTPSVGRQGYLVVNLYKNGTRKMHGVHRIVAGAFLPNPDDKPQVNHKDGNKQNNNVNNLEWCTKSWNALHSLYDLRNHHGPVFVKPVKCVETGVVYPSSIIAANGNSSYAREIRNVASHKEYHRTSHGYHWEWA